MKFPQKLRIRTYGDPVLRAPNQNITEITDDLIDFSERFTQKMYDAKGIGLAAPQIGLNLNMVVIDPPLPEACEDMLDANENLTEEEVFEFLHLSNGEKLLYPLCPVVLLNPTIVTTGSITDTYEEGCLSFPKISGKVERPTSITLSAQLLNGEHILTDVSGFMARVIQHEVDHINGVLFVDHLEQESKTKLSPALEKIASGNQLEKIKKLLKKRT